MTIKYLIRLDDACPTMDKLKWDRIESILDKFSVLPMVGIIPNNEDNSLIISEYDNSFWSKAKKWQTKDWAIALHGYNHVYCTNSGGINPLWDRSEFAGLPLKHQKEKIRKGLLIFKEHNIDAKYFFAPSHTFDLNTIQALKEESSIRVISDTIAFKPYSEYGMTFIPQQLGTCKEVPFGGYWTICLHPNNMSDSDFAILETFIIKNKKQIINFNEISNDINQRKALLDVFLSSIYFIYRKIKKII